MPIIDWLLADLFPLIPKNGEFVNEGLLPAKTDGLAKAIIASVNAYPQSNVIFVHRDADNAGLNSRIDQVQSAIKEAQITYTSAIPVVPVRMTEAWLMVSETALRIASNNPNGKIKLGFPSIKQLEKLAKPKQKIEELIRNASELSGRRLRSLRVNQCKHRIPFYYEIDDFQSLRRLNSFREFESSVRKAIRP